MNTYKALNLAIIIFCLIFAGMLISHAFIQFSGEMPPRSLELAIVSCSTVLAVLSFFSGKPFQFLMWVVISIIWFPM